MRQTWGRHGADMVTKILSLGCQTVRVRVLVNTVGNFADPLVDLFRCCHLSLPEDYDPKELVVVDTGPEPSSFWQEKAQDQGHFGMGSSNAISSG